MKLGAVLFLSVIFGLSAYGQPIPDTLWSRTYGASGIDLATSVIRSLDGGYVIVGLTEGGAPLADHSYFIKVTESGSVSATRTYPFATRWDCLTDIYALPDQTGYIMCGGVSERPAGFGFDPYIMKTSLDGTNQWMQQWGGSRDELVNSLAPADSGGYMLAGRVSIHDSSISDIYLARVNNNGGLLWNRVYGGSNDDQATRIRALGNDTYLIAGYTESYGHGLSDGYLLKVNGSGDTLWTQTYGGSASEGFYDVLALPDGGFFAAGYTYASGNETTDGWVVRMNSTGDTLWTRTYGGALTDYFNSIVHGPNGGFVLGGNTASFGNNRGNSYLVGIDESGTELWHRVWGGSDISWTDRVIGTSDGGYLVVGNKIVTGRSNDILVYKTGPDIGAGAGEPQMMLPSSISLNAYPNPFNPTTTLEFSLSKAGEVQIGLYNVNGELVRLLRQGVVSAGSHRIEVNAADLSSGIYFARLTQGSIGVTKKLMLVR